jgi:hypothetical protein
MDFKLQIVANEQEVDLLANCSLLPVLSRLKNCTKLIKSMIDDSPSVEQRLLAIKTVIDQLDGAKVRLINQHEIISDVTSLLVEKDSNDKRQLELDLE